LGEGLGQQASDGQLWVRLKDQISLASLLF
jgi:hypothetical protein